MPAPVDVFLAYNERDKEYVLRVAEWLSSHGISNYFSSRDLQVGAPIDDTPQMESAHAVLVFLSEAGWGPNHERIAAVAISLQKPIFPILVGHIDTKTAMAAGGPFASHVWLDLRDGDLERLHELLAQLRKRLAKASPQIDALLKTLIGGRDAQRRAALQRIIDGEFQDRDTLAAALLRALSAHAPQPRGGKSASPSNHDAARSWLRTAMVWCQPEHPATSNTVEQGLDPGREPVAFVRFWTLAAVVRVRPSYLPEAVAQAAADPSPDVAFLARSILHSEPADLVDEMRAAMDDRDAAKVFGILRALRAQPVPALAPDVATLLRSRSLPGIYSYDVFCALASPPMVQAAAPILALDPGLETVVGEMALAANDIDDATAANFARLLAALDARRAELLLRARESMPELARGAWILRAGLSAIAGGLDGTYRQMPGFSPDTITGQADHLDIQPEVNTLTAIMMAKDVTPPLAIGLFGEWGTGKSFFMSRMKETVSELIAGPAQAKDSPFCANAVQIHFNAWHYADTSLWASLVSSIFAHLDAYLQQKDPKPDERATLAAQLAAAQTEKETARKEEEQARALLKQQQDKLAAAQVDRENTLGSLSNLQAKDVTDLLLDGKVREEAEKALKELGLPAVIDGMDDLRRSLDEAHSLWRRALAMLMALSRDRAGRVWFFLFVAAMLASPGLVYLIHRYLGTGSLTSATISALFVQIGTAAGSIAALVHRGTTLFGRILTPLEDAKKKADAKLAEKRKLLLVEEDKLRQEVQRLETDEENARGRLDAAVGRAQALETQLKELDRSRTLAYFVAERRTSTDYSKHLGLVSVVRQDFELLVERIKLNNLDESSGQKLERIILYIDDLDRCPADKVVDVLQAVHLLLAYPLFVVVVGVDARWLLNSLTLHYKELGVADSGVGGMEAQVVSPQHYLEKIFQIPYALRPMNRQGYGRLVRQLMGSVAQEEPSRPGGPSSLPAPGSSSPEGEDTPLLDDEDAGSRPPASGLTAPQSTAAGAAGGVAPLNGVPTTPHEQLPPAIVERALVIQPWEVRFAQGLYGLIPSPRSAKRLINVYRVLKAGVESTRLVQFEGGHDAPGEFQLPLLLLAVLIHDTSEANLWFAQLLAPRGRVGAMTLPAMLQEGQAPPGSPRARLMEAIAPIVDAKDFPRDPSLLAYWLPRVARFSFHARHGAMEE